mgnify:CR=1 FL=1
MHLYHLTIFIDCFTEEKFYNWTIEAQNLLYAQNHPYDCKRQPILLCSTRVNKFQGTGSRLFFLARCLTEALNSGRAVVLSRELISTHDILGPFKAWGNCTLSDITHTGSRIKRYYPMDSDSLKKSREMPAVGALFPQDFSERGYWWWKAQEIAYALRPRSDTISYLQITHGGGPEKVAVIQVRRTDKTQGCLKVYGSRFHFYVLVLT